MAEFQNKRENGRFVEFTILYNGAKSKYYTGVTNVFSTVSEVTKHEDTLSDIILIPILGTNLSNPYFYH